MKIKIYKHISLKTQIDDDIKKISKYFSSPFVKQYINEPIIYDVENTSKGYKDDTLFKPNEDIYGIVMFIFEQGTFPIYGACSPYSKKLNICYISVNPIEDKIDYSWKVMVHEIVHALCFKIMAEKNVFIPNMLDTYIDNDNPYSPTGNFSQQLVLLKPYYIKGWKHFKLTEKTGLNNHTIAELKTEFVDLMDKMREECDFPWIITSGYRTINENNKFPNSVEDSAHTTREAVDIYCIDSGKRQILLDVIRKNGINRIGLGITFIHIDISKTLPQNVTWNY